MKSFPDQAIIRKLQKQNTHGGPEVDFIVEYAADELAEKIGSREELFASDSKGLLLYERNLGGLSRLDKVGADFDVVPFEIIGQPVDYLREQLEGGCYDVIICNLAFDWVDAVRFISLLDFLLNVKGVFWFSCYGALTAKHSRDLLSSMGRNTHFSDFYELQDIGDALAGMGFRDVVLESSLLNLEYASADVLLSDAERVFGLNLHPDREAGLMPPALLRKFRQRVEQIIEAEGVYKEQVEIMTAYGIKPEVAGLGGMIPVRHT